MALQYPDIIESSNPKAYGIVKAKEVSGHKTVKNVEDLYELADCILSESGDNTNNDSIGQEWYVTDEQIKYRLIDWNNRKSSSGWKKLEDAVDITIDSSISDVSENPVQNKVIKSELDKKQDTLISGTNIKTINGETLLGNGDITVNSGISEAPEDGKKYVRSNGNWVEETTVDISNLATKTELDGKVDTSVYNSDKETFATKTELDGKVDDSEISDMLTKTEASNTYATKSELSNKQDNLVSGTNIKTINGNSILGSGDLGINIESTVIDDTLSLESENPVQNKVITAKIQELDDIVNPLSISVSGGGLFEKGTIKTITISWTIKKGQSITTADSVTINDEPVEGNNKMFSNVSETTTYTVKATKSGKQVQGSTTVTFIGPMYFGFAQESSATELNISSLNKQSIKSSPTGSYTLNNSTSGYYLWLCIPQNMSINNVTSSGFTVPMESFETKELDGVDTYKCYRSSNTINSGDMKITIS